MSVAVDNLADSADPMALELRSARSVAFAMPPELAISGPILKTFKIQSRFELTLFPNRPTRFVQFEFFDFFKLET